MEIIFATMDNCPHCKAFAPKFEAAKAKYPNVTFTLATMTQEFADKHTGGEFRAPCLIRIDGKKTVFTFGNLEEPVFHKMIETGEVPPRQVTPPEHMHLAWLYGKYGEVTFRLKFTPENPNLLKEKEQIEGRILGIMSKRMAAPVYKVQPPVCSANPMIAKIKSLIHTDCKLCLRARYGILAASALSIVLWLYN